MKNLAWFANDDDDEDNGKKPGYLNHEQKRNVITDITEIGKNYKWIIWTTIWVKII